MRQGPRAGDALQLLNLALTEDERRHRTTKSHGAPGDTPDYSPYFRDGALELPSKRHPPQRARQASSRRRRDKTEGGHEHSGTTQTRNPGSSRKQRWTRGTGRLMICSVLEGSACAAQRKPLQ
jgi:hypothetical protein